MKTLFWALFGINDLEVLEIKGGQQRLTESVGHFMYALYLLVAVIVLLNALIAMMSSTYARVHASIKCIKIKKTFSKFFFTLSYLKLPVYVIIVISFHN